VWKAREELLPRSPRWSHAQCVPLATGRQAAFSLSLLRTIMALVVGTEVSTLTRLPFKVLASDADLLGLFVGYQDTPSSPRRRRGNRRSALEGDAARLVDPCAHVQQRRVGREGSAQGAFVRAHYHHSSLRGAGRRHCVAWSGGKAARRKGRGGQRAGRG